MSHEQLDRQLPRSAAPQFSYRHQEPNSSLGGSLPSPGLLSGYEATCPGAADRIIRMAEQEVEHRRATETLIVQAGSAQDKRESDEARRGQICALFIVIASIGSAVFLGINGHEISASALGLGALGSVVTTFILGRRGQAAAEPDEAASITGEQEVQANLKTAP